MGGKKKGFSMRATKAEWKERREEESGEEEESISRLMERMKLISQDGVIKCVCVCECWFRSGPSPPSFLLFCLHTSFFQIFLIIAFQAVRGSTLKPSHVFASLAVLDLSAN